MAKIVPAAAYILKREISAGAYPLKISPTTNAPTTTFIQSQNKDKNPGSTPNILSVFVDPIFPLPCFLISVFLSFP
jgi:hypothetical protein